MPVEIGHNEIGDAEEADWVSPQDAESVFAELGFPALRRVPLMSLDHQIAQKLHAVTGSGDRARDLVDLQLIMENSSVGLAITRRTCERLFAYRKTQAWPPEMVARPGWEEQYELQAANLPVAQRLDDAVARVNDLIKAICESES